MNASPRPNLQVAELVQVALKKCRPSPAPYRRPRLQPAPHGWTCHRCHAQAAVFDGDDFALCAEHGLQEYDATDLPDMEAFVGAALDGFARAMEQMQERADFERELREGGIGR